MKRFRIISKTGLARDTRIFYIDEEAGVDQEISAALQGVRIEANVDDLNHAEILMNAIVDYEIDIPGGELIFKVPEVTDNES